MFKIIIQSFAKSLHEFYDAVPGSFPDPDRPAAASCVHFVTMTTEIPVWCQVFIAHRRNHLLRESDSSYVLTAGLFSWMLNCNSSDSWKQKLKCRNWKIHNKEWRFNERWKPAWRSKHPKRQVTKKLAIKIIQIISTVKYNENKR